MSHIVIYQHILDHVYSSLTNKPGRVLVASGFETAWDDCCDGQLSIRVSSVTPRYTGNSACPVTVDLVLSVELVRCVHSVSDRGRAPSAEELTLDGMAGIQDMIEVANALQCWEPPDDRPSGVIRSTLGEYRPIGPQGGCAGGSWMLNVRSTYPWVA